MKSCFFTVDRGRQLKQDQVIELTSHQDIVTNGLKDVDLLYGVGPEKELQAHIDALFPSGVSELGNRYFLCSQMSADFVNEAIKFLDTCESLDQAKREIESALSNSRIATIEILFEYVRRSCFPDKPSRFTSVFAWETLDQARAFRKRYGEGPIWEVECDERPFRADMNLVTLGKSVLTLSYSAHRYWSGLPGINADVPPWWEVLLTPPVRVLQQVREV